MALLTLVQFKKSKPVQGGFLLLETLISITIFAIFILFFLASFNNIFATQDQSWKRTQAGIYAQEGVEVSYNIITNTHDWTHLINSLKGITVYQVNVDSIPGFLPGGESINEFNRQIRIEEVFRSAKTHEIVEDKNEKDVVYDPETLLIRCTVHWNGRGGDQDVEYVTYVTRRSGQ